MHAALAQAKMAYDAGEVPIGAVLVQENMLIAGAYNRTISDCDPTAHSEIVVLREAAKKVGNYRLNDATLYVTVEPCAMCVGALLQARIKKLVFGAYNAKSGACGSVFDLTCHKELNHRLHEVKGGVLHEQCSTIMQEFFITKREG